jgi:hypothetical protein
MKNARHHHGWSYGISRFEKFLLYGTVPIIILIGIAVVVIGRTWPGLKTHVLTQSVSVHVPAPTTTTTVAPTTTTTVPPTTTTTFGGYPTVPAVTVSPAPASVPVPAPPLPTTTTTIVKTPSYLAGWLRGDHLSNTGLGSFTLLRLCNVGLLVDPQANYNMAQYDQGCQIGYTWGLNQ